MLRWVWEVVRTLSISVLAAVGLAALAAASADPLRTALQIGADEHCEVTKGLLWAKGFPLYQRIWSDQPPLYSVLLGVCFKGFGPNFAAARTLAICFGLSLLAACALLMGRQFGAVAAFLATICLLSAPQVFELSVSAMQEVPAIGTALWGFWPLLEWQRTGKWRWLAVSGGLVAVALQIKLTAAVVVPALAVELLFGTPAATRTSWLREAAWALTIWGGTAAGVFAGLVATFGAVPLGILWGTHFSTQMLTHAGGSLGLALWPRLLWCAHPEAFWGTVAALVVLVWRRHWRRLAFPLVWLFTVALVHVCHRPWWPFYYLHFAVPLAWLSGYGIAELFRVAWANAAGRAFRVRLQTYGCLAGGSLLLALVTAYGGDRLWSEAERIHSLPRVEESGLVAKMRQYADRTRWVYTRETIYPFHAGLLVVPELAVLSKKRFWSGQITDEQIWATVRRYRPEQLLLDGRPREPTVQDVVKANYTPVYQDGVNVLYVANELVQDQE